MWKKIMECWYALWGQSHGGGFGCGCRDYENENLEKKKIEGKVNARNVRNKRGTKKSK